MQPTHNSKLFWISSGTSPCTTTSETASRPPGLSTRKASLSTRSLSAERLMTQLEMITSTESAGSGISSISPRRNSTLVTPDFFWFSRASASMSSVMSRPYALPVGPTRRAESSTSIPPPEPRSRTVSPGLSSASAVGLPQPSEASTASAGSPATSAALYRSELIGSQPHGAHPSGPQQLPRSPASTSVAASAYRARTVSLNESVIPH